MTTTILERKKTQVDFLPEVLRLMNFVASVAKAIHTSSPYDRELADRFGMEPSVLYHTDVLWLSDSIQNFDMLVKALLSGEKNLILNACFINLHNLNQIYENKDFNGYNLKAVFERASRASDVNLNEARQIFLVIKEKAEEM